MSVEIIKKTNTTPELSHCKRGNYLEITGKSLPEDPREFYKNLTDNSIKAVNEGKIKKVSFYIIYFNTLSAKYIYEYIKTIKEKFPDLIIEWRYEKDDEDMLEAGQDFEEILGSSFKFREV